MNKRAAAGNENRFLLLLVRRDNVLDAPMREFKEFLHFYFEHGVRRAGGGPYLFEPQQSLIYKRVQRLAVCDRRHAADGV